MNASYNCLVTRSALLAAIALMVILSACTSPAPAKPKIRVMTYNIHHGEGQDREVSLERIAAVINSEKPDLVALQEVDRGVKRTNQRDQPAELAQLTGMHVCFERNIEHQGGDYGNAILSRFPILKSTNTLFPMLHPHEQRGALQAVLEANGEKLLFISTHLDYRPDDTERLMNVAELRRIIAGYNLPVLLCGDFNVTPDSIIHERLSEFMNDAWLSAGEGDAVTLPGKDIRIDFIWVPREGPFHPVKLWVPQTDASDHRPVVGDFLIERK